MRILLLVLLFAGVAQAEMLCSYETALVQYSPRLVQVAPQQADRVCVNGQCFALPSTPVAQQVTSSCACDPCECDDCTCGIQAAQPQRRTVFRQGRRIRRGIFGGFFRRLFRR